ncbi:hypothetical protein KKA95_05070 [Patescibacteria group bacterium]|nr:hypothetical protein [Patescibacteria group bacterium]
MPDNSENKKGPHWISAGEDLDGEMNPEFVREMIEAKRARDLKWALEHPIGKRLAELHAKEVHVRYNPETIERIVLEAKDIIELASSMRLRKPSVQPENAEKLKSMKRAIEDREVILRKGVVGTTNLSAPEDMLHEIDEIYAPIISRLNAIINQINEEKPKESVSYLVNESMKDMKALFETIIDMVKYYQDQLTNHFITFRGESVGSSVDRSRERISDIGSGTNGKSQVLGVNMRLYKNILEANEEMEKGFDNPDSENQAQINGELFTEAVHLEAELLGRVSGNVMTVLSNIGEPGIRHPLGETESGRMKKTLEYLHFALRVCERLEYQSKMLKLLLKKTSA